MTNSNKFYRNDTRELIAGNFGQNIIAIVLVAVSLIATSGCTTVRHGNATTWSFDKNEFQSEVMQEFNLAKGTGVLRKTNDNHFQIKIYGGGINSPTNIYDLGEISAAKIVDTKIVNGVTVVALQLPGRGCEFSYQLLQISDKGISYIVPQNRCVKLNFSSDEGSWKATQMISNSPRYWVFRDHNYFTGRDKSSSRRVTENNKQNKAASATYSPPDNSNMPASPKGMLSTVSIMAPRKVDVESESEIVPVRVILMGAK